MVTLYRCDWCAELIDPVEGGDLYKLYVEVAGPDGEGSKEKIDLCSDCCPDSAGAHLDWVDYHRENDA